MGENSENDKTQNQPPEPKTYSQDDVERIVKERIATAKKKEAEKFGDYDELKKAAARLKDLEAGQKSDLEKAIARAEKAEKERDELSGKIDTWKKRQAARSKAKGLFEKAEIRSEGWELLEELISPEDDDETIAAKLEKIKKAVGTRSVGGSGRNVEPPKPGKKTIDDAIAEAAAEAQKTGDAARWIALLNKKAMRLTDE